MRERGIKEIAHVESESVSVREFGNVRIYICMHQSTDT